jgi:short-subunit dehydrogenase
MNLAGRTVLITGASSGIGAATAREMRRRGAQVLLVARRTTDLEGHWYPCDLADPRAVPAMAARIRADGHSPDIIVNCAGAGRFLFLDETTEDDLAAMTAVPYFAAFRVTREFIDDLRQKRAGWIVTVNSPASRAVWPGAVAYAGARWALRGFTAALSAELKHSGIGVTEIVPGKVASDYFANNPGAEDRIPKIGRIIPTLSCEQVATAICDGVERERRLVVSPRILRLMLSFPRPAEYLLRRTGAKR